MSGNHRKGKSAGRGAEAEEKVQGGLYPHCPEVLCSTPSPLQNESNRSCKIHSDWDERSPKERRPHIIWCLPITGGAPQVALVVKNPSANAGDIRDGVPSLSREDTLEEGTATHSGILAWRIPWTEEPGELKPTGLQRVRHD